jgi:serine/threonine protein kinase
MAPEQAVGGTVDRRADIWAFGVVLYEMLTGRRLYAGDSSAEILASVIKDEPKLDQLQPRARYIIERCLRKEPRRRWQAIGDVRNAIDEPQIPDSSFAVPRRPLGVVSIFPDPPDWLGCARVRIFPRVPPASWHSEIHGAASAWGGVYAIQPSSRFAGRASLGLCGDSG